MAKAWGHPCSGIEGLRPHLITAQALGRAMETSEQALRPIDFVVLATKIFIGSGSNYDNNAVNREENPDLCIAKSQGTVCLF